MKKSNNIWIVLLLLASCRQDTIVPDGKELYPVTFSLPEVDVMTRATEGEALTEGETLMIAAYNPDTKEMAGKSQYVVISGGLGLANDATPLYLSAGTYDFCTMVPGTGLSEDGRFITVAAGVDALGSVTRAQMLPEPTSVTLNSLEHLTSQVSFTVRVVTASSPIETFKVKKIVVNGMVAAQDNNYKLPKNEWVMPATNNGTLTIDNSGEDKFEYSEAPEGKNGKHYNTQKYPLIIFPRAAAQFQATITLDVKETDEEVATEKEVVATINKLAFEPGKSYQFEVNYGWDFVGFTITVTPWNSVNNGQNEVGGGEQEIQHRFEVNEWGDLVELGGDIG
ncbi:fimbrillin family protein [Parabacteroides gordonii]|uniref:Fimbrillin family protein n=1 Tax=Parabacteroides gordonii MS-1 = DSM 23371 TaxID=1203610 RepID=A0A0F5J858_9BACT|nr:fimbrillin family protein [Parabacteroides gordonii]KKB54056.1 hypothetical protein HMPREF1536_03637 [Parabacteroides gordonii MS-1 = DSM 23371]MCA5584877.1 fimbrillin family protein [Parabacteroides gordonii]